MFDCSKNLVAIKISMHRSSSKRKKKSECICLDSLEIGQLGINSRSLARGKAGVMGKSLACCMSLVRRELQLEDMIWKADFHFFAT
jgi:hypothetical protein